MLSSKLEKALHHQINFELYSAFLYLHLSEYFASKNLRGFSGWMKKQFEEEQRHALNIFNFVIDRGNRVEFEDIKAFNKDFDSILEVFEYVLDHEEKITRRINALVNESIEEQDHATATFLQWYDHWPKRT